MTDEKGEGLPGMNVVVKGTANGTSTDVDGRYSITVPDNAKLVVSYVDYTVRKIAVGGRTTIDVPLAPDAQALSEVVGYTTQNRQNLTSAVSPVDVAAAKRAPVATITEAIQGRTTGVQISNSGTPGQAPIFNIRGIGTLNGGSAPLFMVDGLWTDNIRDLNPTDIASLTVLKDASSTSTYGSQGANGVVIITTKKGKAGKPTIGFNAYAGVQNVVERWDLTNASEWAALSSKRSYFTQAVYDYKNRYLLTGSFRRDGSSRFDPENHFGNFGAGSLGWRISEENFLKESAPYISNLKARVSYGVNGNDAIGEYRYQGVINQNANYVYDGNLAV